MSEINARINEYNGIDVFGTVRDSLFEKKIIRKIKENAHFSTVFYGFNSNGYSHCLTFTSNTHCKKATDLEKAKIVQSIIDNTILEYHKSQTNLVIKDNVFAENDILVKIENLTERAIFDITMEIKNFPFRVYYVTVNNKKLFYKIVRKDELSPTCRDINLIRNIFLISDLNIRVEKSNIFNSSTIRPHSISIFGTKEDSTIEKEIVYKLIMLDRFEDVTVNFSRKDKERFLMFWLEDGQLPTDRDIAFVQDIVKKTNTWILE